MREPSHPAVVAVLTDPTLPLRFWSHATLPVGDDPAWPSGPNVDGLETPCWIWTHNIDDDGYGRYVLRSHQSGAGRIALAFGEAHGRPRDTPPEKREWQLGGKIAATCGHRACVRPSHLRVQLSDVGRESLLTKFGRTTLTLAELPPSAVRRAAATTRARPAATPRPAPVPAPVAPPPALVVQHAPPLPSSAPDIHPPGPDLAGAPIPLPDGRALVVAIGLQFKSGAFLVYTPWGPFDGATIADATARAIAAYPGAHTTTHPATDPIPLHPTSTRPAAA